MAQSNEVIVPGQNVAFSSNRRFNIQISATENEACVSILGPSGTFKGYSGLKKQQNKFLEGITRMIMNLFGYENAVFNSEKIISVYVFEI